jgi:hypothetical protein
VLERNPSHRFNVSAFDDKTKYGTMVAALRKTAAALSMTNIGLECAADPTRDQLSPSPTIPA